MTDPSLVLAAIYRRSLLAFAERAMTILEPQTNLSINWHHEAIAYQLERCYRGENRRLIINQPPKTLKTHLITIAHTAWLLMHDPSLRIAIICYDEALASTQLRKIRQILRSRWFRRLARRTVIRKEKATESLIEMTAGGEVRALSAAGGITGYGFDVIIIDDPQKASLAYSETERRNLEDLYSSAIANRWRNPAEGVLIVVMQRLHVDDFTSFLLRACADTILLSIPAIAPHDDEYETGPGKVHLFNEGALLEPDRLSHEVLQEMRSLQGEAHYRAQYLQAPMAAYGQVIDPRWFLSFVTPREPDYTIISIDPAFTDDGGNFSAALVCNMSCDEIEIIHGDEVQYGFPRLIQWIRQLDNRYKPDLFLLEAIGAGKGLRYYLREHGIDHVETIESHGNHSKLHRMEMVSPKIARGLVRLPESEEWARRFRQRMAEFPGGASDDCADALSQLLLYQNEVRAAAHRHRARRFPPEPPPDPHGMRRGLHYRRWDFYW